MEQARGGPGIPAYMMARLPDSDSDQDPDEPGADGQAGAAAGDPGVRYGALFFLSPIRLGLGGRGG